MKLNVALIVVFLATQYPENHFVWFIVVMGALECLVMIFEERSNRKRL